MPIPDPDKIWPKLEEDGVDEVKKKLSMGVYATFKIPVIEEWLQIKEFETSKPEVSIQQQIKDSRVDQFLQWAKNHQVVSIVLILCMIIIAMGTLTDAISKISNYFNFEKRQAETKSEPNDKEEREPFVIPKDIMFSVSKGKTDLNLNFKQYIEKIRNNNKYFSQKEKFLEESQEKVVDWIGYVTNVRESEVYDQVFVTITTNQGLFEFAVFVFLSENKKIAYSLRKDDKVSCTGTIKKHYMDTPVLAGHSISIIN